MMAGWLALAIRRAHGLAGLLRRPPRWLSLSVVALLAGAFVAIALADVPVNAIESSPWRGVFAWAVLPALLGIGLALLFSEGHIARDVGKTLIAGSLIGFVFAFAQYTMQVELSRQQERDALRLQVTLSRDVTGIDLHDRDLSGWYLAGKIMVAANLSGADLSGANFSGADLSAANLAGANLLRANLAPLPGVTKRATNLSGADMSGANLAGANFSGANLTEANLVGAVYYASATPTAGYPDFTAADLRRALIDWEDFGGSIREADISGHDFRGVHGFDHSDFHGVNASGAIFDGLDIWGSDFQDANLAGASFRGTYLDASNLTNANLQGAMLVDADFCDATLRRANLTGANLAGADLNHADLTEAVLAGADLTDISYSLPGDSPPTIWPAGFEPPSLPRPDDSC